MMLFVSKLPALVLLCLVLVSGLVLGATQTIDGDRNFPNTLVVDQNGESHEFYNDLVKDKIVAINFVLTRCNMVCPMLGFKFGRLRDLLGSRAGTEVFLISVSTDATYDTPERLKSWADQFNAGTGWTQVTGEKQNIDQLLKSLKAFSADKQDHSTLVLLGNDKLNEWKWIDGASGPQVILSALSQWHTGAK